MVGKSPSKRSKETIDQDERVTLERLVEELGWARNTVRRYLADARRAVVTFPNPNDGRKVLYPLRYTVRLLQREHDRVQERRRMKEEGENYWTSLAGIKVAIGRLRRLALEASSLSKDVQSSYEVLRRRQPLVLEICTLPGRGLALEHPLTVLVAPLRRSYWRAVIPEIDVRGEGRAPEGAVKDLREKLANKFRQLQEEPSLDLDLWHVLSEIIRPRRIRGSEAALSDQVPPP